ncbi:MAG: hypothetical protein KDK36_07795, partial [Leptospiraceae bacterium]|nr:hypothetical protein [Leptospiraceae bacterium]
MFEFVRDNSKTGFRLERFEVLNWGTFNNKIWKIEPNGFNSLLTGDIGSGKSTLVDGITTLLIQQKRITYNKAAGAEGRERTLYLYIRGAYGSLKGEESSTSKTQYLRDNSSYSVLLGSFYNSGFEKRYSLAQVFWLKENSVEKFFVIADSDLNIKDHFTSFGKEISELRKRLRKMEGVELIDSYKEYSSRFRNNFGIRSDKALDLFYHTVSMKSINNLNEFIRENMLEKSEEETAIEIEDLKNHFNDLNESHNAIIKAKIQIKELEPVIEKSSEQESLLTEIREVKNLKDSIPFYFADKKILFYKTELEKRSLEKSELEFRIKEIGKDISILREEEREIEFQMKSLDEVREKERLELQKKSLEKEKEIKKGRADTYNQ